MGVELLLALAAGGGAVFFGRRLRQRRSQAQADRSDLEMVRRLAAEDVIFLGEELDRLDARTAGRELDSDARRDYRTAVEAYESAQRAVDCIGSPDEISRVVDSLAAGRFAIACVVARVEGGPLPTERTPCFFNPQHGPATEEMLWTRPGRGTRRVPVCARDAARGADGQEPEVRMVELGGRTVPYWEAGEVFQSYTNGYFPTAVTQMRREHDAVHTPHNTFIPPNYDGGFQAL
jgi:hypothetical protein